MNKQIIELKASDLTASGNISCPSHAAHMEVANMHPKVYFNVSKTGEASCPYCGTTYRLTDGSVLSNTH
jgi:uncharacterized Zn-finger protein